MQPQEQWKLEHAERTAELSTRLRNSEISQHRIVLAARLAAARHRRETLITQESQRIHDNFHQKLLLSERRRVQIGRVSKFDQCEKICQRDTDAIIAPAVAMDNTNEIAAPTQRRQLHSSRTACSDEPAEVSSLKATRQMHTKQYQRLLGHQSVVMDAAKYAHKDPMRLREESLRDGGADENVLISRAPVQWR